MYQAKIVQKVVPYPSFKHSKRNTCSQEFTVFDVVCFLFYFSREHGFRLLNFLDSRGVETVTYVKAVLTDLA